MNKHIIIWQGEEKEAGIFAEAMRQNRCQEKAYVICIPSQETRFEGLTAFQEPEDNSDAEKWERTLKNVLHHAMTSISAHESLEYLVLNVFFSASSCGNAHRVLEAIRNGAERVGVMRFVMHVVLQVDTMSPYAEDQRTLLTCLQRDVEQYNAFNAALNRKKQEINQDCEQKVQNLIQALDSLDMQRAQKISDIWAAVNAEKNRLFAEAAEDLKKEYQWLEWERLSVLSDHTEQGSAQERVRQTRSDILYGVVINQNEPEPGIPFQCLAYSTQRSAFTRRDVLNLPAYTLYEKISAHVETVADAQQELLPRPADLRLAFANQLSYWGTTLQEAMLLDDENYEERTGRQLLDSFAAYNRQLLYNRFKMNEQIDAWVKKVKQQLACWVDVDHEVKDYIGLDMENDIRRQIDAVEQGMKSLNDLSFGRRVRQNKRFANIRTLQASLADKLTALCLERMIGCIADIRAFLENINQVNDEIFAGYDHRTTEALAPTQWSDEIMQDLREFELERIEPSEDTIPNYRTWLMDALRRRSRYFQNPEKWQAEDFVLAEDVVHSVESDVEAFKLIDAGFHAQRPMDGDGDCFLGASTRAYRLTSYLWNILDIQPDRIISFYEEAPGQMEAAKKPQRFLGERPMEIELRLVEEKSSYEVQWTWPAASSIQITVVDGQGLCCFSREIAREEGGTTGRVALPLGELPRNAPLRIRAKTMEGRCQEIEGHIAPRMVPAEIRPAKSLLAVLSPRLSKWLVTIPPQMDENRFMVAVTEKGETFFYPICADENDEMILLHDKKDWKGLLADETACPVSLTLK